MIIRHATIEDLEALSSVEAACFPATEAATKENIAVLCCQNHESGDSRCTKNSIGGLLIIGSPPL